MGLDVPPEDENGHVNDAEWEVFERQCASLCRGCGLTMLGFASAANSDSASYRRSRGKELAEVLLCRCEPLI